MTRPVTVSLLLVAALVLGTPAVARAQYFIDERQADALVDDHFRYKRGYRYVGSACHPRGLRRPRPGYIYHTWVCSFAATNNRYGTNYCRGTVRVKGSADEDQYYIRVLTSYGNCPRGA